ncbi:hypothetical protein [Roseicyclus mahoneyensis]|uniref:Uncharacterized protein n=1 Tax=Roseicyclus mahoneyensis TaxID=164332 RepID=A0A316GM81_9RHOB|nr:hypothetical protein [Roseicyclus mahoneyensis]PWK61049.1 hypothetical protein C7455_103249 [Roseicyclus mahoneyensis]
MRGGALIALTLFATPAGAEGFDACFARSIAHFEMEFARTGVARTVEDFALVTRDRVHHCGSLAIVACDRGDAPQACQRALAADQRALTARVLGSLPVPAEVPAPDLLPGLYPQLWDVAHGTSAGDDCAGADEPVAAWCDTHEARLKLTEAVALWQVARLMGVSGPALELGWVADAMPFRPVARPEGEEGQ